MKKWLSPLCLLAVLFLVFAGCGEIDWFPDKTSTSNTNTNTNTNNNNSGNNSGNNTGNNTGNTTTDTAFVNKCNQTPGTEVVSNAIVLPAFSGPTSISVSGAGSAYSIDGGDFESHAGFLPTGAKTVRVRHTTAAAGATNTVVTTVLTVGSQSFTFQSDTANTVCH